MVEGYATLNGQVFGLLLKVSIEETRLTGVGRGFRRDGAAYAKQRLRNPYKWHLGTLRRFLVSDRRSLVGVYRDNNSGSGSGFTMKLTLFYGRHILRTILDIDAERRRPEGASLGHMIMVTFCEVYFAVVLKRFASIRCFPCTCGTPHELCTWICCGYIEGS